MKETYYLGVLYFQCSVLKLYRLIDFWFFSVTRKRLWNWNMWRSTLPLSQSNACSMMTGSVQSEGQRNGIAVWMFFYPFYYATSISLFKCTMWIFFSNWLCVLCKSDFVVYVSVTMPKIFHSTYLRRNVSINKFLFCLKVL